MGINQHDIAEALNVSVMTVSRALRHHPDLADSTRESILKKAEELGYRKHLKKNETVSVEETPAKVRRMGILLYEDEVISHQDLFKSGVVRSVFLSVQKECQRRGVETVVEVFSSGSPDLPILVKNRSVEGIFLLGRYADSIVEKLGGIPALAVSNYIECVGLPHVVADNFHGMRVATEHLIDLGHKQILFLGDLQGHSQIFQERSFGYLAAMQANKLKPDVVFFDRRSEPIPVPLIQNYTAVVCSNDSLAYRVKTALKASGVDIPGQCSLVSFDNIEVLHQDDPITSYAPDWELLGRVAAELMLGASEATLQNDIGVTVPGKLAVYASTCAPSSALVEL